MKKNSSKKTNKLSRRSFLTTSFFISVASVSYSQDKVTQQERKNTWDHFDMYEDEKTGAKIYKIVTGSSSNTTIYQTHPQWGKSCEHFYFLSNRSMGKMQLHRLERATKNISPVLEEGVGNFTLSWETEQIYFFKGEKILKQEPDGKRTEIGIYPEDYGKLVGGIGISADEEWLYCATQKHGEEESVLRRMRTVDGKWEECTRKSFLIGHVQPNFWNTDLVMFCWETGGDSPQRTWYWSAKTREAEPFFVEKDELWVTHEVWWGKERALFTIWPYDEEHKKLPHGVAETNIEQGKQSNLNVLAQYPAWHTHGSHDFKWVLGDDFDRNIWLIYPEKKEKRLLVTGKIGNNLKVHPHASFLPDNSGIVFNTSRFGYEEIHLVLLPENFESLPYG